MFGSLLSAQVTHSCNVPKIAAVKPMSRFLARGLIGAGRERPPGPRWSSAGAR
jgi:hypothetical protein